MNNGLFIVLEGLDGAGGETLSENLVKKCKEQDISCLKLKYPDYTSPWGAILHEYLDGELRIPPEPLFLTYAADQLKDQAKIQEFRQTGLVICDRYVTSAIAYESVLGVAYDKAIHLSEILSFEPPDLIIYLDISPEVSIQRKHQEKGELDIHEENTTFLAEVREIYKKMSENNVLGPWIIIDGTKTPEAILETAWKILLEKKQNKQG
jgi:dTMP kinase